MPGALTRGRSMSAIHGVVWHHTASGPNWNDSHVAFLLRDGRRDLAGPLSQLGLERGGTFVVVATGKANHNGYGMWGNDSIGIEAYNDGVGEPWAPAQVEAYQIGTAAILKHLGKSSSWMKGHRETDPRRKIDPAGLDMSAMRRTVSGLIVATKPDPIDESEDDDMGTYVQATDGDEAIFHFYGERVRQLTAAQWIRRYNLSAFAGNPIAVQNMTGAEILTYCDEFQIIADPPTK